MFDPDLLELTPAPNNGTKGALNHMMTQPKDIPRLPEGVPPAICLPASPEENNETLGCTHCEVSFPQKIFYKYSVHETLG